MVILFIVYTHSTDNYLEYIIGGVLFFVYVSVEGEPEFFDRGQLANIW